MHAFIRSSIPSFIHTYIDVYSPSPLLEYPQHRHVVPLHSEAFGIILDACISFPPSPSSLLCFFYPHNPLPFPALARPQAPISRSISFPPPYPWTPLPSSAPSSSVFLSASPPTVPVFPPIPPSWILCPYRILSAGVMPCELGASVLDVSAEVGWAVLGPWAAEAAGRVSFCARGCWWVRRRRTA